MIVAPVALRDELGWHDEYARAGSPPHLRLLVVQDLIAQARDERPCAATPAAAMPAVRLGPLSRTLVQARLGHRITPPP